MWTRPYRDAFSCERYDGVLQIVEVGGVRESIHKDDDVIIFPLHSLEPRPVATDSLKERLKYLESRLHQALASMLQQLCDDATTLRR